jgi:hypothetical protein
MRRKLFTLAAAASAVVCLVVILLWVRSYWVAETWDRAEPQAFVSVGSSRGQVGWVRIDYRGTTVRYRRSPGYHAGPAEAGGWDTIPTSWSFAGFRWISYRPSLGPFGPGPLVRAFTVPDCALVLAAGILPGLWLVMRGRRHRAARKCCRVCGYDLRDTPNRCPECGTAAGEKREPVMSD